MHDGWLRTETLPEGDPGTRRTVRLVRELIRQGAGEASIRAEAEAIIDDAGVAERDTEGEADAIFEAVRDRLRFQKDPLGYEMVTTATGLLHETRTGDCDDFTVLLGSLLESVGIPTRTKTVRHVSGRGPYRHIYLEAFVAGGWKPYDPTNKNEPAGWEVMHSDPLLMPTDLSPVFDATVGDLSCTDVLYDDDLLPTDDDGVGFIGPLLSIVGSVAGTALQSKLEEKQQEKALEAQEDARRDAEKAAKKQLKLLEKLQTRREVAAATTGGGELPKWVVPTAVAGVGLVVLALLIRR